VEQKVGKFTFTIPEGHPQAGEQVEKPFTYNVCQTEEEARDVMAQRKLSVLAMVNEQQKKLARSNAYQAAMLPYKPSEVSPEDIKERMIRDYIRMGKSEAAARRIVERNLAEEGEAEAEALEAQDTTEEAQ